MELIKNFVITLVTLLIFIAAVELITPDNSMKKYVKFVLGLILTAAILSPILSIALNGEEKLKDSIESFQKQYDNNAQEYNHENVLNIQEESFKENLTKNCENMLEKEFEDLDFLCEVDCEVNFKDEIFNIKKIDAGIKEKNVKKVKKVEKVEVNKKKSLNKTEDKNNANDEFKEVVEFISREFKVDKDKINIYKIE